jgi:hypothetical protein
MKTELRGRVAFCVLREINNRAVGLAYAIGDKCFHLTFTAGAAKTLRAVLGVYT